MIRCRGLIAAFLTQQAPIVKETVKTWSVRTLACTPRHHATLEVAPEEKDAEPKPDEIQKRLIVDVQTSLNYMQSNAYRITYGDALVWQPYRRNHKGALAPEKTRKTCIRKGVISTGNPCPICRDAYLVLHPQNVGLLQQFITPQTGQVLSYKTTGLCQMQHKNLLVALHQAWDQGLIEMVVPFRRYNYEEYYEQFKPPQSS